MPSSGPACLARPAMPAMPARPSRPARLTMLACKLCSLPAELLLFRGWVGGRRSLRLRLNSAEAEALLGLAELGNI